MRHHIKPGLSGTYKLCNIPDCVERTPMRGATENGTRIFHRFVQPALRWPKDDFTSRELVASPH
jgi:hypothetical protein